MIRGKHVYLSADIPFEARAWRNSPEIRQWCRQYTLIDDPAHRRWLDRISADPSIKMFGVHVLQGYRAVGVAGLTSIDRINQSAEFSLYIAPEHQNMGYGRDALRTLIRHGFKDHNLNRIWGETYAGNPALRMFLVVGMREEGVLRQAYFRNGQYIDVHRVAILRGEYGD